MILAQSIGEYATLSAIVAYVRAIARATMNTLQDVSGTTWILLLGAIGLLVFMRVLWRPR